MPCSLNRFETERKAILQRAAGTTGGAAPRLGASTLDPKMSYCTEDCLSLMWDLFKRDDVTQSEDVLTIAALAVHQLTPGYWFSADGHDATAGDTSSRAGTQIRSRESKDRQTLRSAYWNASNLDGCGWDETCAYAQCRPSPFGCGRCWRLQCRPSPFG